MEIIYQYTNRGTYSNQIFAPSAPTASPTSRSPNLAMINCCQQFTPVRRQGEGRWERSRLALNSGFQKNWYLA